MMTLSPQAQRLLDLTRRSEGPTARDRKRLYARVVPLLTAGTAGTAVTAAGSFVATAASKAATPSPIAAAEGVAGTTASGASGATVVGVGSALVGVAPVAAVKLTASQFLVWMALGTGIGATGMVATVVFNPPQASTPRVATAETAPVHSNAGALSSGLAHALVLSPPDRAPQGAEPSTRTDRITPARPIATSNGPSLHRDGQLDVQQQGDSETPPPLRPENGVPSASLSTSTLGHETRLLQAAQAARRAGRNEQALTLLAEHARLFPHGVLRVERSVAQVLALCAEGREAAANRLRERVLREAPDLPATSRIHEPCAAGQRK